MKSASLYIVLLGLLFTASTFPQQITIVTPNGGENIPAGASYGIRWTDNISEQVRIELYKNDSFYYTIVDSTPSNAYYAWYVPDTTQDGSDYKIKITSVVNNSITDFSDSDFTIIGNHINVTSPNGGENWQTGYSRAITWTDNINENVKIELFKAGSPYYTITPSTASNGYFSWMIPDTTQPGADYQVKITSVDFSSISDISDSPFSLYSQNITVTAPNGGETLPAGTSFAITWSDNITDAVKIELIKEDSYYFTISDSTASNGYYSWAIPDTVRPDTTYKVKITSLNNNNTYDLSDTTFTIFAYQITVITPNGGENLEAGSSFAITWSDNISEYVAIQLFKSGSYFSTIADSTPSDAYYTWNVPDTIHGGSDYRIKIMSVLNSNINDLSDSNFTITAKYITVTTPNGADTTNAGSSQAIRWNDNLSEGVNIELYKSGSYYYTIVDSTPSDGYYSWYIPDTLQNGLDYKIKISSVAFSSINDFSDSNFTIIGNYITISEPNGGEQWLIGSPHGIRWSDNINEGVTIQLFKGGSFYYTIVDTTPSNAYYAWTIPDTITIGNDYTLKIMSVDFSSIYDVSDGNFTLTNTTNIEFADNTIPEVYSLSQNFPNPFNPSTYIMFGLPHNSNVNLVIYDITGQRVITLINNEPLNAGIVRYRFNASRLASGIYIYRIVATSNVSNETFVQTKKMILLK